MARLGRFFHHHFSISTEEEMRLFTTLARNSLWLLAARIGAQICMVVVTYLLARRLGNGGFGEYSFIAAAIAIGNTLTTFGSDMYLIRDIAAGSEFSRLASALILQIALSGVFILGVFLFAPYLPNQTPETVAALRVYCLALIPLAFFTVFTSALRGRQSMDRYAWLNLAVAILQAFAVAIFIQRGTSLVFLAYLLLILQVIGAILGGILCGLQFPGFWQRLHLSFNDTLALFVACAPIALIAILGILCQKSSIAMLSFLGGASMLGWFSAALRVVEAARMGHVAVLTALYPAIVNKFRSGYSIRAFGLSWLFLLVVAAGGTILLSLFAEPLVVIFFGSEYLPSVQVLRILAFILVPYTVNSFLALVFLAAKEEMVIVRALIFSLLILTGLNFWLIPQSGAIGASWSILIAELIQSGVLLLEWKTRSTLKMRNFNFHKGEAHELPDLPG
jgi:O-antigen/teichoic acid export membrane protein